MARRPLDNEVPRHQTLCEVALSSGATRVHSRHARARNGEIQRRRPSSRARVALKAPCRWAQAIHRRRASAWSPILSRPDRSTRRGRAHCRDAHDGLVRLLSNLLRPAPSGSPGALPWPARVAARRRAAGRWPSIVTAPRPVRRRPPAVAGAARAGRSVAACDGLAYSRLQARTPGSLQDWPTGAPEPSGRAGVRWEDKQPQSGKRLARRLRKLVLYSA